MFAIDCDTSRPIYEQIIDGIKKALVRRELEPGDRLPSQREMAGELQVNPNTVQRAYREMERSGLVETARGQGTFIKKGDTVVNRVREEMVEDVISGFLEEMEAMGYNSRQVIELIEKMNGGGSWAGVSRPEDEPGAKGGGAGHGRA